MIFSYCNYGICNDDTSQCLEEWDTIDRLSYFDDEKRIVLENVQVKDIDENEITIETEYYEEITIAIEDVEEWD